MSAPASRQPAPVATMSLAERIRDPLSLLGVLATTVASRRPVRPLADEAVRSLPGDELGLFLKVFWHPAHFAMQRRQLLNLKRLVEART